MNYLLQNLINWQQFFRVLVNETELREYPPIKPFSIVDETKRLVDIIPLNKIFVPLLNSPL